MSIVTLTCPAASASVAIDCKVVYGTDFFDIRLNHHHLETADGTDITYDIGPTKTHGTILMKNVQPAARDLLLDFIWDKLVFSKNKFTISAISGVDFGLGRGVQVTNCLWDGGDSTKGVFTHMAPGIYTVNFPYKFTRGY